MSPQTIGGADPAHLAERFGTPLLAFDLARVREEIAAFERFGAAYAIDAAYAGKAFLCTAFARLLRETALAIDVCSLGELLTAERANFPAERIVFHGCGKSDDELRAVAEGRAARIVVDHREELERLAGLARPDRPVALLLRINPGIEAHTHAYVRTGGEDSKFGFPLGELEAAARCALAAPGLRLVGLHTHIGSNIFDAEPYEAAIAIALERFARLRALGAPLEVLIAGGGFGVDPSPQGPAPDRGALLRRLRAAADAHAARLGIAAPRLGVEPGRAIVAAAGTSLYRVLSVKQQGSRRFAIVDGGLADNPRPMLYGSYHHPTALGRTYAASTIETTICGRSCENDPIVSAALPGDLRAGDLIGLGTAGAYTFSMAGNYNRFPKPAVVFVEGGTATVAVRRQPLEALVADDA